MAKDLSWLDDDEEQTNIVVKDANGNILKDGDTLMAIKDLPVKGGGSIKRGDTFKNIRLTDDPTHVDAGKVFLKTEFFKKV